jgi:hypothetical protein
MVIVGFEFGYVSAERFDFIDCIHNQLQIFARATDVHTARCQSTLVWPDAFHAH